MENQETFWDGLHASISTTFSGMLNSRDISVTGNIPVQASTGKHVTQSGDRDHNQSWAKMAKIPNIFSISVLIFDSWRDHRLEFQRSSRRSVFKELKSQEVSGFSETLKGKDWRKGSRGRTELAVHLKTISTAVLTKVIAQLHLPVNSAKSVLGSSIRLMNSQAEARSD